jgi:Disulphide bond corrector protein DsbC
MKKLIFTVVFAIISFSLFAQLKDPASFTFEAKKKGAITEIVITATIAKPWHLYSQNTPKGGPIPTKISFNKNPLVSLSGNVKETGKLEKIHDKNFDVDVLFYSNKVVFSQQVKVKAGVKTNISGTVEYMVCDDEQCLPPTKKPFSISL